MTRAWRTLAAVDCDDGRLELRKRADDDFLIALDGRVVMNSRAQRSEQALAARACEKLAALRAPRVLIGGLGMGFTLRAALDALPASARVAVAELNGAVVDWCRGPLAALTDSAAADPRVAISVEDVARAIERATPGSWDAILLDLYEGPRPPERGREDPIFGAAALARARAALSRSGVLAVWSEAPEARFEKTLRGAGFAVECVRVGRGGRRHAIYLASSR